MSSTESLIGCSTDAALSASPTFLHVRSLPLCWPRECWPRECSTHGQPQNSHPDRQESILAPSQGKRFAQPRLTLISVRQVHASQQRQDLRAVSPGPWSPLMKEEIKGGFDHLAQNNRSSPGRNSGCGRRRGCRGLGLRAPRPLASAMPFLAGADRCRRNGAGFEWTR